MPGKPTCPVVTRPVTHTTSVPTPSRTTVVPAPSRTTSTAPAVPTRTVSPTTPVATVTPAQPVESGDALPHTGANVAIGVVIGSLLLAAGTVLVLLTRKRRNLRIPLV